MISLSLLGVTRRVVRLSIVFCFVVVAGMGVCGCATDSVLSTQDAEVDAQSSDEGDADTVDADSNEDTKSGGDGDADNLGDADLPEDTDGLHDAELVDVVDSGADTHGSDAHDVGNQTDAADTKSPIEPGLGECRETEDCAQNARTCVAPGEFNGCGICRLFTEAERCKSDLECQLAKTTDPNDEGEICAVVEPQDCSCDASITICKPACATNADCELGEKCLDTGHCVAQPCSIAAEVSRACRRNFECVNTMAHNVDQRESMHCKRRHCAIDSECPQDSICVKGACYDGFGTCEPMPR